MKSVNEGNGRAVLSARHGDHGIELGSLGNLMHQFQCEIETAFWDAMTYELLNATLVYNYETKRVGMLFGDDEVEFSEDSNFAFLRQLLDWLTTCPSGGFEGHAEVVAMLRTAADLVEEQGKEHDKWTKMGVKL
jgi:hypothetical protein